MIFQAHRGVCTECPENTMPAFETAVAQGYPIIELDLEFTKDQQLVVLHDKTINRTARDSRDQKPEEPIYIWDITYEEALSYDFGLWFSEAYRGTKIPLFSEVLEFARQKGVRLKIDNKYQRFTPQQQEMLFAMLEPYTDLACLTCSTVEAVQQAHSRFPDMFFHYDGLVSAEILQQLQSFLKPQQLAVWLPLECPGTAWVKTGFATKEKAEAIKACASLGIWILSTPEQLQAAEELGADIVETPGQLKP